MNWRLLLVIGALALGVFSLSGCGTTPTPTAPPPPTSVPIASSAAPSNPSAPSVSKSSGAAFETKSNEGGSITVDVQPTSLAFGEPVSFDIAMNTHSVELSDDLTNISILRDDTGREYKPTGWDGPDGGGHHRSGTLKFPALIGKPKSVELVIKGMAKVPERVFKWDMP